MKPYVIVTPKWNRFSGGITVLHRLCHELNEAGQEAYIIEKDEVSGWKTPFISYSDTLSLAQSGDGIIVYPEICKGNPYLAKNVVRWVLNNPGLLGGDKEYPESEMKFTWVPTYYDADMLHVNCIEMDLFKDEGLERTNEYWFMGKGKRDFDAIIPPEGAIEITKGWPATRAELAQVFKTAKVFHSYDVMTALNMEATLCGCPTIIYPSKRITKEEWKLKQPIQKGQAFGSEELEQAKSELPFAREEYEKFLETLRGQLQNFITKTQCNFQ